MSEDISLDVTEMPDAFVSEDGEQVVLKFKAADGQIIELAFDGDRFRQFSSRAIQLFTHAQNEKLTIGDHSSIQPVESGACFADSTIGGARVLLGVLANNGVPYHFAISPEEADTLRPQLHRAAKSAMKQKKQSRH